MIPFTEIETHFFISSLIFTEISSNEKKLCKFDIIMQKHQVDFDSKNNKSV